MELQGLLSIQDPLPHPSMYQVSTAYEECLVPIDMHLYTAPPGPPTGVTAVQSGPTSVSVSWTAPTSGGPVSRYDIYYGANRVPSTSGGSTSYVLTNLQVGVQYNISVIAVGTYIPSQSATFVGNAMIRALLHVRPPNIHTHERHIGFHTVIFIVCFDPCYTLGHSTCMIRYVHVGI